MSIVIGADIVPIGESVEFFTSGNAEELVGTELLDIIKNASYRIFNLEVPLTDISHPISKYGPHLIAPTSVIKGLKSLDINLVTLANNHIMDQADQGLTSTLHVLNGAGISYVGAGQNRTEAQQPYYFTADGKRYGVYACAEHEFSITEDNKPGANPFDPLESLDHIVQMKTQCDYAIVLYHGGKEHYRYPSPNLQKTCRKIIEKGANIIICQHSHCIGCMEKYKNGTIIYGQGNFLFNKKKNECWNTGLLIRIDDADGISFIPYIKNEYGIRLAKGKDANSIISSFDSRSKEIVVLDNMVARYNIFAEETLSEYILYFLGINDNIVYRIINKITGQRLRKYIIKRTKLKRGMGMRTYIECESHRELLLKGLRQ